MTRIRATCPDCGDVEIRPDAMLVTVAGSTADGHAGSSYSFVCTGCQHEVVKAADTRVLHLLTGSGCNVTVVTEPQQITAWVARLDCSHDLAARSHEPPTAGDPSRCETCHRISEVVDVIAGRKAPA